MFMILPFLLEGLILEEEKNLGVLRNDNLILTVVLCHSGFINDSLIYFFHILLVILIFFLMNAVNLFAWVSNPLTRKIFRLLFLLSVDLCTIPCNPEH